MHKPDGKDVAEVSKDVSPTIKARHHRDGLTVTGSCSSLHAKLTPGSRGSLIFSMQLWEEDSKESAALHAKALYEPDEVVKTFKPTLTDHETSLASAIDQVGVGANAAGDIAVAIPVPQAMAAGAALKGISQAWSIGSKIYQSWRYPDFEGLYLTIFRYRCEADGVVEWYWEPDDQHIHEAPIPLPAAAAAPNRDLSNNAGPYLFRLPAAAAVPPVHASRREFRYRTDRHHLFTASVSIDRIY